MAHIAALRVTNLVKNYSHTTVLRGVDLEVHSGEILGLVGLNGMGKTTIIKSVLNLIDIDQGKIEIFGVSSLDQKARSTLCYLPEKFQPSSLLKGHEFLSIFLGKSYSADVAENYAGKFALNPQALQQRIGKYSKGMTQKLGLIYAFMSSAKLIILDEPMSGLDPRARINLKTELLQAKNEGRTIFFSSHILNDVEEICDSLAVLHEGKVVFRGKVSDFRTRHQQVDIEKAFLAEIGVMGGY